MTLDAMLDKIDHALLTWETMKGAHGLSPDVIAEGNRIIAEEKAKKKP